MNDRFYDLILVNINFREVNQYLNIARKLASEYRIGVYDIPLSRLPGNLHNSKAKVKTTDKLSLQIMESFGVSILSSDGPWHARLCLVPQSLSHLQTWNLPITFNMACALERFRSGAAGAEAMCGLGIDELWVFDRVLYSAINVGAGYEEGHLRAVEMGTPYKRYPALDFSDLKLDYILANPTTMLLVTPKVLIGFQINLARIVNSITEISRIAAKRHNVPDNKGESSALRGIYRRLTEIAPLVLTKRLARQPLP